MRQAPQVIFILLYSQFLVLHVFTLENYILSEEKNRNINDTNNITLTLYNEWKCALDDDCTVNNSVCSNHLCQCDSGFIFNADMTACVKVATRLYDSCEDTVQCSAYLLSGAKCTENVCVCGPGYYYLHGRCNRHVGLFEKCKQDIECYVNADFEAATCDTAEEMCKCKPGFYQREYRTCRREGKAVGDECTIDIDCTFNNATCNEFVCAVKSKTDEIVQITSDITLSKGLLDEKTQIGSDCETDEDCKAVNNAICGSTGTCRCDRAYFASNSSTECIPELGEPCQNGENNSIEKSICREGKWSCTSGTVASKDNRECLDVTREYMGNCQLDEQCYVFGPDATCNNNQCTCNENTSHYVESELFCWGNTGFGETCQQDLDCFVKDFTGNLICNDTCTCPTGMHLSKDKMTCVGSAEIGGFCEKNNDCITPNSACDKKQQKCTCAKNHYESNRACLAGIDAKCTSDENCAPDNTICISDTCSCKSNYVPESINSCIPVSSFGESCLLDTQCSAVTLGAICASTENNTDIIESSTEKVFKMCTCAKEDYYKFGRCLKIKYLGEACTNLGECYECCNGNRMVCKSGKCACNWGYMPHKSNASVCVEHPESSKFFLRGGGTNIVPIGLFSVTFIICLSNKLF